MADQATLQGWLTEAETALHELNIGQGVVKVQYEGKMTEFAMADVAKLRAYIADLKKQLGLSSGRTRGRVVQF